MIRRNEYRNNAKKLHWRKENIPDYGYSETSVRRNRSEYGISSQRKPMERHHSDYTYNTYDNWYNDWQDIYKPNHWRDQYSTYNSTYDTDDDETYRYQSRNKYGDDDYYYDTEYTSYYDEDETDYTDEKSHSENKHSERRQEKMFDDSKYLYRYEENHPGYGHSHIYNRKNKINIPSETDHHRHRNHMDIYAVHNTSGQTGFKNKTYKTIEPQHTPQVISETEKESGYRRQEKKKRKPEYKIYAEKTTNGATAFDKKLKSPSPEKLVSVTDYQDTPLLGFKQKNRRGSSLTSESDLVYLPVVMKEKNKKLLHQRNVKNHPMFQYSTETAEKPLENNIKVYAAINAEQHNIFKNKKNRGPEQNPYRLNANQKGINVYAVSSGMSNVFKKSGTKIKNFNKIRNKKFSNTTVKTDNSTENNPDTGSYIDHTSNKDANIDNEMTNMKLTDSGGSIIVPLETRSVVENQKSMTEPPNINKASDERSITKSRDKSVARKSSNIMKTSSNNNNIFDTDTEGQNINKSTLRQSYVPPTDQSIVNERKSLATNQQSFVSGLQSNNQNTPLKGIIKPSIAPQSRGVIKKSYVENQQDLSNNSQYLTNNFSNLEPEDQDFQRKRSTQSTAAPKSAARQINVLPKSQTSTEKEKSLVIQQTVLKSLLRQNPKKSVARQSSATQRSQNFEDINQITGIEEKNVQKSTARQSGVLQKGQSVLARDQIEETELQNPQKSLAKKSSAAPSSQAFGDKYQLIGVEEQRTQKSMARQSNVPKRGQSFVDGDNTLGTEGQSTQKSLAMQSSAARRGQSALYVDNTSGTEGQVTQKSLGRQSNAARRGQSLVERDKTLGTEGQSTQQSLVRQSSAARRGQSALYVNNTSGTEGQVNQKSLARQSSAARRGQSALYVDNTSGTEGQVTQKSLGRQSNAARRGQSLVERDKTLITEGQSTQQSLGRQSNAAQRGQSVVERDKTLGTEGQSTQQSLARQSGAARRAQSLVDRENTLGTDGQSTRKSLGRQSALAQREQNFEDGKKSSFVEQQGFYSNLQEIETQGPQSQIGVLGPSAASKRDPQKSSARQQTLTRNEQGNIEDHPQSNIKSGIYGSTLKQPQQSGGIKQPKKSKSKTMMKKTLSKLFTGKKSQGKNNDSSSKLQGQNNDSGDSSTTPLLDVIMSESVMALNRQPSPKQPVSNVIQPVSETSSGSIKQHAMSTKPKKSTKSKLSKPFKSLLGRSKKSDSRQRQPSNIEYDQPLQQIDEQKYIEQKQLSLESTEPRAEMGIAPTSEVAYDQTDVDDISYEELKYKKRGSSDESVDYPIDDIPPVLKEYDLTSVLCFLQIAKFIVGVTIDEKLMEVFAVL